MFFTVKTYFGKKKLEYYSLKMDDRNTSFFHNVVKRKNNNTKINRLRVNNSFLMTRILSRGVMNSIFQNPI